MSDSPLPFDTQTLRYGSSALYAAVQLIAEGQPVAMPTETVYGLAADASNPQAVARIYAAKDRPTFNPLIVHVSDLQAAQCLANFNDCAKRLAAVFWPGALTIIAPLCANSPIAALATAGLPTVALRVPAHRAMQALLAASGCPLAAPSANHSGAVSPTRASHVVQSLQGRIALVVDDGACGLGIESTIVSTEGEKTAILRHGAVTASQLEAACGVRPIDQTSAVDSAVDGDSANDSHEDSEDSNEQPPRIIAPGQLSRHYSPDKPMRLNARRFDHSDYIIGFGDMASDYNLSTRSDMVEAAARLFDALHCAAASPKPSIAVAPIPTHGLGQAIADRLHRAAIAAA